MMPEAYLDSRDTSRFFYASERPATCALSELVFQGSNEGTAARRVMFRKAPYCRMRSTSYFHDTFGYDLCTLDKSIAVVVFSTNPKRRVIGIDEANALLMRFGYFSTGISKEVALFVCLSCTRRARNRSPLRFFSPIHYLRNKV